jgi:hypothetical protein
MSIFCSSLNIGGAVQEDKKSDVFEINTKISFWEDIKVAPEIKDF